MHPYYTPLCTLRNLVMILANYTTPLTHEWWPWETIRHPPWWNLCESGKDFPLSLKQPLLIRRGQNELTVPIANDEVSKDKEFSLATFVTVVPWMRYQSQPCSSNLFLHMQRLLPNQLHLLCGISIYRSNRACRFSDNTRLPVIHHHSMHIHSP